MIQVFVAVSNLALDTTVTNPSLVIQNGEEKITVTEDGLYAFPSVVLGENYNIVQSTDSVLHEDFLCTAGEDATGVAALPFVSLFVVCGWNSKTQNFTVIF